MSDQIRNLLENATDLQRQTIEAQSVYFELALAILLERWSGDTQQLLDSMNALLSTMQSFADPNGAERVQGTFESASGALLNFNSWAQLGNQPTERRLIDTQPAVITEGERSANAQKIQQLSETLATIKHNISQETSHWLNDLLPKFQSGLLNMMQVTGDDSKIVNAIRLFFAYLFEHFCFRGNSNESFITLEQDKLLELLNDMYCFPPVLQVQTSAPRII